MQSTSYIALPAARVEGFQARCSPQGGLAEHVIRRDVTLRQRMADYAALIRPTAIAEYDSSRPLITRSYRFPRQANFAVTPFRKHPLRFDLSQSLEEQNTIVDLLGRNLDSLIITPVKNCSNDKGSFSPIGFECGHYHSIEMSLRNSCH